MITQYMCVREAKAAAPKVVTCARRPKIKMVMASARTIMVACHWRLCGI